MTIEELRAYIAEYAAAFDERLSDPRVVDIERFLSWLELRTAPATPSEPMAEGEDAKV